MKNQRICPYCNKEITNNKHYYRCSNKPINICKKQARFDYITFNFPDITKEILIDEYCRQLFSLPDFRKKYGISYSALRFILEYYNIPVRDLKESSIKITKPKNEATCLNKYGSKSTFSKGCVSYNKRVNRLQKQYGVSSVFKLPEIKKKCYSDNIYLIRYGLTRKEKKSKESKDRWINWNKDERREFLSKSLFSLYKNKKNGISSSKLEQRIANILIEQQIPFIQQYDILTRKNKSYYFDFLIINTNIIIEVNGDYWHANPELYKSTDIIKCGLVSDIWKRDDRKRKSAAELGYSVLILWEKDIRSKNDDELKQYIKQEMERVVNE